MELNLYEEVVHRIRGSSDMMINLTTGAGAPFIPTDRDPIGPAQALPCGHHKDASNTLCD